MGQVPNNGGAGQLSSTGSFDLLNLQQMQMGGLSQY